MRNIIILGGQGDGTVLAMIIEDIIAMKMEKLNLLGFLNDSEEDKILGYPVLGKLRDASIFTDMHDIFFISALLKTKQSYQRSMLLEGLHIPLSQFTTVIHPTAIIARSARIGYGTAIGPHATVMPNARIGNHCSIRASANIGHDCVVEDFCYVGPNTTLAGRSMMKTGAHLGSNSCVLDSKTLGAYSVVGIGSSVLKDTVDFGVFFGCPAQKIGYANKY